MVKLYDQFSDCVSSLEKKKKEKENDTFPLNLSSNALDLFQFIPL